MSYYRQPYQLPYSAAVQGGVGNSLSDMFDNSRPQAMFGPFAAPNFAEMDAKWLVFNPADNMSGGRGLVDTRAQMATISADGKALCAMYQQLPVPTVDGESVELAIYSQLRLSYVDSLPPGDGEGGAIGGIFIADDLLNDPDGSTFTILGQISEVEPGDLELGGCAAVLVGYDALPDLTLVSQANFGFQRIRLRQSRVGDVYNVDVLCELGNYGTDWLRAGQFFHVGIPAPFRSCGFCLKGAALENTASLQVDNFVVNLEPWGYGGSGGVLGGVQNLGSI